MMYNRIGKNKALLTKYEEMRPERPLVELKKKKAY